MGNLIAPPGIIFVNNEITPIIQDKIEKQLFITETIDGDEFDARISVDPDYLTDIYGNDIRLLVVRSFREYDNRELADIVLFYKHGLVSIEKNNFGPPQPAISAERMYLSQLLWMKRTY